MMQSRLNDILHTFKSSIWYYLKAKTKYNIHSSLQYNLLRQLYKSPKHPIIKSIESRRKSLLGRTEAFEFQDFGAGSRRSTNNKSISKIVRYSSSNQKKCSVLYNIVHYFQPQTILELGTNLGFASMYMKASSKDSKITTLEGSSEIYKIALGNFEACSLDIDAKNMLFDVYFKSQNKDDSQGFDLAYIDGNHKYEATLNYFNSIYNPNKDLQIIILDDIYWSSGMTEAWKTIVGKLRSGVAIDLFQMGLIIHIKESKQLEHYAYIDWKYKPFSTGLLG